MPGRISALNSRKLRNDSGSNSKWFYFAHPDSKYFPVGKISAEQVSDLARRKNFPVDELTRYWRNLN